MEVWGSAQDTKWMKRTTPAINHQQSLICLRFNPSGSVWTTWFSPFLIRDCWKNLCKTNHKSHILSASPGNALIFHWNRGNQIHRSVFATIADVSLPTPLPFTHFSWEIIKGGRRRNRVEGILRQCFHDEEPTHAWLRGMPMLRWTLNTLVWLP